MLKQDGSCSNRKHHSGVINKQGRSHEVRFTVCASVKNPDLMFQKTGDSQSLTHSRPAECDSRQAIQARPDHPNRVVSPSRGFPEGMQQVAPSSNTSICHDVQQQLPGFVSLVPDPLSRSTNSPCLWRR